MTENKELFRNLKSGRARFYPIDFHVHTPASYDVRVPPHIDTLPGSIKQELIKVSTNFGGDLAAYEAGVIQNLPVTLYYSELLKRRDEIANESNLGDTGGWAIIALTDHNVCKYSCEVSAYAWEHLRENLLVILPGIELSVIYGLESGNEKTEAHILCIFSPLISDSDMRMAISEASDGNWIPGNNLEVNSLPEFVYNLRHHDNYPGICIAAHVGSSKGIQTQTKDLILSRRDAAISRTKGELSQGVEPDTKSLEAQLKQLVEERDEGDTIAIEVLEMLGQCGFDALQVRGKEDEVHYKRLHRYDKKSGRAVPIVCSDAHSPASIFEAESGIPHLKLSSLSSSIEPNDVFESIRTALRLGETRFNYAPAENPISWISGIQIAPDAAAAAEFWPYPEDEDGDLLPFILPLSRNLNCIIGGRGSGKSAVLEAIAFVATPQDFIRSDFPSRSDVPDYYSRASATIAGCRLKLCWQYPKHVLTTSLSKKAIFQSRYFDDNDNHSSVEYHSLDGNELVIEQIPPLNIQYYRLGEIEQQAHPKKLRALFDSICGPRVQSLDSEIEARIYELVKQRKELIDICESINNLTGAGSPLREYYKRKILFEKVNTIEISATCEELDKLSRALESTKRAIESWDQILNDFDSEYLDATVNVFFEQIESDSTDQDGETLPYHDDLLAIAKARNGQEDNTLRQNLENAIADLGIKLSLVESEVTKVDGAIKDKSKDARERLQEKGLPAGIHDRDAKKEAFDLAKTNLDEYVAFLNKWDTVNRKRKQLVQGLLTVCTERSDLRSTTAAEITQKLHQDLDQNVLVIDADAQAAMDKSDFLYWMDETFSDSTFRNKEAKFRSLIEKSIKPGDLRSLLMNADDPDLSTIEVPGKSGVGGIDEQNAQSLYDRCRAIERIDPEFEESEVPEETWDDLPNEIKEGLISFPATNSDPSVLRVDSILYLDEIIFDDIPIVKLNDRPKDAHSTLRPLEELSPGQRCSAILPILLITGSSPLVIDQPEDNMDNRLIRQVIVNILSSIKLRRQVIFATHNPNLPVLGDVEQAIILQGIGEKQCELKALGDLDDPTVVHHLTDVMEGGREAFQFRQTIYQGHWEGAVDRV